MKWLQIRIGRCELPNKSITFTIETEDPHPPIYFRVNRLEKLETPVEIKHPLIQSAKDVINGFSATL